MTNAVNIAQAANSTYSFKNRIINGAMQVNQYGTTNQTIPTGGSQNFPIDRFAVYQDSTAVGTATQSSTAPKGFANSLGISITTGSSVSAANQSFIMQTIEGNNIADLGWGTANAQTVTLSFWVYSSLTGTNGGSLFNSAGNRFYNFVYTVPTANTWTQISITIAGDTSGTWLTNNGAGIRIRWNLGSGSNYYQSSTGSWGTSYQPQPNGGVQIVANTGATFYFTGVQLEVGTQATSFDYRDYGRELMMCQRYFVQIQKYNTFASASYFSSTRADGFMPLPVPMRTTPSFVVATGANYYRVYLAGVSSNCSTVGFNGTNQQNSIALIYNNTDFSGLANGAGWWDSPNSSSSIGVTAEL